MSSIRRVHAIKLSAHVRSMIGRAAEELARPTGRGLIGIRGAGRGPRTPQSRVVPIRISEAPARASSSRRSALSPLLIGSRGWTRPASRSDRCGLLMGTPSRRCSANSANLLSGAAPPSSH